MQQPDLTNWFMQLPWIGGVNTALDPSVIPPNQLVVADHVEFGTRGSRKKRDGINFNWDGASDSAFSIVGLHDFWFGTSGGRTQKIVGVGSNGNIYSYSGGTRTTLGSTATAWSSTVSIASMATLNNLCVIAVDGSGNKMRKWDGSGSVADLGGTPPQASVVCEHLGRLFANDKTNLDRLHYSPTGDVETWSGVGDSGAIDIGVGDGDPTGITAIISFKGVLFVAKSTKIYRVDNVAPEEWSIKLVSKGVGIVGSCAWDYQDQDDVFFVSQKGVHSLSTTDQYGDFEGSFVSVDIQKTFNDSWVKSRLPYAQLSYVSNLNSIALGVSDTSSSATANKHLWLYNVPLKSWYSWSGVPCQSMTVVNDSDKRRLYLGTDTGRVAKTAAGTNYDTNSSGSQVGISYLLKTGIISLDGALNTEKAFKRFSLIYGPIGGHTVTVSIQIDNYTAQPLAYSQVGSSALLGSSFSLGTSKLDAKYVVAPYAQSIDGHGRGVQLTITQSGIQEQVEIQGFAIEFEPVGVTQEIIVSG